VSEITDLLRKVYGKTKRAEAPKEVKPSGKAPALLPTEQPKSVGDVTIALQAQSIYSPDAPPAPPSAPNAKQAEMGTVGSIEAKSKWDRGNE
jgi:hypothetical protein